MFRCLAIFWWFCFYKTVKNQSVWQKASGRHSRLCFMSSHCISYGAGLFPAILGKRPLAKIGEKMIDLAAKLGEINDIEQSKGSKIYPQSKLGCKDREFIQSSTTPDPGYLWESDKLTYRHHNESQEVRLSQQVTTRHISTDTYKSLANTRQKKHKRSTKEVPPWNGQ